VEPAAGCLGGPGQRGADHHGVGAAGEGLGDVAAGAHAAVGDDLHVAAALVQVPHPGRRGVGDGRALRDPDPEHLARRAGGPRADPDQDADGPRPHQVEGRLVRGAPSDDDGKVVGGDELLEVQGLRLGRDVLGGDDRALDDQDVEVRLHHDVGVALDSRRRQAGRSRDAGLLDLGDALVDQLFFDRLLVELLHPGRGRLGRQGGDLLEHRVGILVAGLEALEVQDREPAEPADGDGRRRRDDGIHGRSQQRQLEPVALELPADVDVVGVPGPPGGHDRQVVEAVRAPGRLAGTNLHFQGSPLLSVGNGYPYSWEPPGSPALDRHSIRLKREAFGQGQAPGLPHILCEPRNSQRQPPVGLGLSPDGHAHAVDKGRLWLRYAPPRD
jgi:hypothetical protein